MNTSSVRSYTEIAKNISKDYIKFYGELERMLISLCEKDKNLGKIVELVYNDYERNSLEYYMKKGLDSILREIGYADVLDATHVGMSYHQNNILVNLLDFIDDYIHTENETKEMGRYGFKLTNDKKMKVECYWFNDEKEMKDCGYSNKSDYIIESLIRYGKKKIEKI